MSGTMVNTIALAIFTLTLSIGQLLFKQVGLSIRGLPMAEGLLSLARQPMLYAALTLYGFATLLWIWILSRVPLMQAYPWVSAGVVIVPLAGVYFFNERASPIFWLGVCLVVAGILITQYSMESPG